MNHRLILLTTALVTATPAFAQLPIGKPILAQSPSRLTIEPVDAKRIERLDPIISRYNDRIDTAFKGEPLLKKMMEQELQTIAAQKDSTARKSMILAYQRKYGARYQQILARNNVSLATMAREMSAAAPELRFNVRNGIGLSAGLAAPSKSQTFTTQSTGGLPALAPTEVRTLSGNDYRFISDRSCTNIAGGEVTRSGGFITATANATVAGGCRSTGSYEYEFAVAPDQLVDVDLTFGLSGETFAIGILGGAFALSFGEVSVFKITSDNRRGLFDDSPSTVVSCRSMALVLMSDADECEIDNEHQQVTISEPGRYLIRTRNNTSTLGVMGGGSSESKLRRLRATLTFRPQ